MDGRTVGGHRAHAARDSALGWLAALSRQLNFNGGATETAPGDSRGSSPHVVQHLARIGDTAETQVRFTECLSSMSLPSPTELIAHLSAHLPRTLAPGGIGTTSGTFCTRLQQLDMLREDGSPSCEGGRYPQATDLR